MPNSKYLFELLDPNIVYAHCVHFYYILNAELRSLCLDNVYKIYSGMLDIGCIY